MMNDFRNSPLHVAVLMGGPSDEHEISKKTGTAAQRALERKGHHVLPVLIGRDGRWKMGTEEPVDAAHGLAQLVSRQISGVFLGLHGTYGEDGTIQGALDTIGMGYQGSGVISSATAMDKSITKSVLRAQGLPVADEIRITRKNWLTEHTPESILAKLGTSLFVKPACQGSSVGASPVHTLEEIAPAVEAALAVDTAAVVEPLLVGPELTCGVLTHGETGVTTALPAILIEPVGHAFFDFESKYTPGHNREICPAPVSDSIAAELARLALACHHALECRDLSRTDFIQTQTGLVILETNTLPGLTEASLIPLSAKEADLEFDDLVENLLRIACSRTTYNQV